MPFAKRYHTHPCGNAFCRAPRRFLAQCVAVAATTLLLSGVIAHTAEAQAPPLGDAYVFFVDGVNVTLPVVHGEVVDDPKDDSNKAIQFKSGQYEYKAFRFQDEGATPVKGAPVDMSANRDAGNALSFRILVDPANEESHGNEANLAIMFEDFGAPPTDPMDLMTADLPFRLRWTVPTEMRDGEWHEVSLTLPPATWKELEDGKLDKSIAGLDTNWVYGGTWTMETEGVALDLMGPNTAEQPELWQEFEWDNVRSLGVFWDWPSVDGTHVSGPVHLDDVFIGPADYDLSDAAGKPAAMTGVMVAADGPVNVISWTHNPDFGGYNVYASEKPITDVSAEGVLRIGNVSFEADAFEVRHRVELPSSAVTFYYAVTSLSAFGVENADVSNSAVEIANPDITSSPWILPLTAEQDEQMFDLINEGMASNAHFPEGSEPFVVDDMHSQLSELNVTLPDNNEDLSAKVWVAYYEGDGGQLQPQIYVYAEVADDVADYATKEQEPNIAWQYDSIEIGWGNYDVIDAGGTLLGGSPHSDMGSGEFPDYQLRISPHGSPSDAEARTFVSRGDPFQRAGVGGAAYQSMTNGYKVLAQFDATAITAPGDANANFPGMGDPVRYMPFTITLNDADGEGNDPPRVHQITWSLDPTVNNNWWNTPSQWQAVAMGYPEVVSAEGDSELPEVFALDQNYPNPFNPATTIRFQLPQAEQVTLRVFDVLGREVATLLEDALMGAGEHTVQFDAAWLTSGLYLYRLEAGASFAQTRRMMLVK